MHQVLRSNTTVGSLSLCRKTTVTYSTSHGLLILTVCLGQRSLLLPWVVKNEYLLEIFAAELDPCDLFDAQPSQNAEDSRKILKTVAKKLKECKTAITEYLGS